MRITRLIIGAILIISSVLFTLTVKSEEVKEQKLYIVILEENTTYKVLTARSFYINIIDIKQLIEFHSAGDFVKAEEFYNELIKNGKAIFVPNRNYFVSFIELGTGYAIYEIIG